MKTKDWKLAKEAFQLALDNNCAKLEDLDGFMDSDAFCFDNEANNIDHFCVWDLSGIAGEKFIILNSLGFSHFDLTDYTVTYDNARNEAPVFQIESDDDFKKMFNKQLDLELVRRLFDEYDRSPLSDKDKEILGRDEFKARTTGYLYFLAGFKAGMEHGVGGSKTA